MPVGKNKIDSLHDQMPAVFNTKENLAWKALIEAIGQVDQDSMELIEAVRQQFFIKTAKRPYLDRLGTANLVQRPRFIGMDDPAFRRFIPVMAYNPKQVKLILDDLLDIFFFKDATTSFATTTIAAPFVLKNGWELEYEIDSYIKERIQFNEEEFSDISNATASEIVSAINRQSSSSYAIAFEDGITKEVTIRIFTNTVGAKGAVTITGGRANIGLQFDGYNKEAGVGVATEWQITKSGDTVTIAFTGTGGSPKIEAISAGDVVIINRFGNTGSFLIKEVDVVNGTIKYTNLLATPETFAISIVDDVKFMALVKNNVYLRDRRAIVWQVSPGEIIVEVPPSPPVVKRNRKGAAHINGVVSSVVSFSRSLSNMTLTNPSDFPADGAQFYFIPENEIQTYFPNEGDTTIFNFKGRLASDLPTYTYTSKIGDLLQGITPSLPTETSANQFSVSSANRDSSNVITVTTTTTHNYQVGNYIIVENSILGAGAGADVNGTWKITSVINSTEFEVYSFGGPSGSRLSAGGTVRMEKAASATVGGLAILRSAQLDLGKQFSVSSANRDSSNVITVTTTTAHNYQVGNYIIVENAILGAGTGADVNGTWKITSVINSTQFKVYSFGGPSGSRLSSGGTVRMEKAASATVGGLAILRSAQLGPGKQFSVSSANRDSSNVITVTTTTAHNYQVGNYIIVENAILGAGTGADVNGTWKITSVINSTQFKVYSFGGPSGSRLSSGGTVRMEKAASRKIGPYLWSSDSEFILSSLTTDLIAPIKAGLTQKNIQVLANDIPSAEGNLIFDFGTENQEGPVRYFFKPSTTTLALDPSYVFKKDHAAGSAVTMIRRRGSIKFQGYGSEHAPYITDPAAAREVLKELMERVKSVGIFLNFIIRYPIQYYSTVDVYSSGIDPG